MNEMLKSIIEMDKTCRLQAEDAVEAKQKALDELTSMRTSLIAQKMLEAKETVETIRKQEMAKAKKSTDNLRQKNDEARKRLNQTYTANSDKWIDELYTQIIK